jgi:hypothetical protein
MPRRLLTTCLTLTLFTVFHLSAVANPFGRAVIVNSAFAVKAGDAKYWNFRVGSYGASVEGPANQIIETGAPVPNHRTPSAPRPVSRSPFEFEPAKPSQNEPQLPNEDLGVDIGVVISDRANLREGPSTTNPVIRELQRGELVVLLSRVPVGPWYRVIHVKSSLEGWVNGNTISVRYTQKPKPPPLFQERETGSYENPDIEITNDSDKTLYLRVGDEDRIVIAAHSTQTITKPAGTYWFYAVCPGVLPAFGERSFRIGFIYTWRFYIVTTYG